MVLKACALSVLSSGTFWLYTGVGFSCLLLSRDESGILSRAAESLPLNVHFLRDFEGSMVIWCRCNAWVSVFFHYQEICEGMI